MKILLFVTMLVMAPLGFTQAYGGGGGGGSSSGGGGYGGGGSGGAIAGLLLVGGLIYFLTRDTEEEEETSELISQSSEKPNRFEFNFETSNLDDVSNTFQPTNFESPQGDLKFIIKYNLN